MKPYSALHIALRDGDTQRVAALFRRGAVVDCIRDEGYGRTLLFLSVGRDDLKSAKTLLLKGAKMNVGAEDGRTPPHVAAIMGHRKLCDLFRHIDAMEHGG